MAGYDPTRLRRRVVYLQQTPVLADASVRDNLLLPFRFRSADGVAAPTDTVLEKMMADFGLDGFGLEKAAGHLSVGQKLRLALIRVLLLKPEALLLDEPTSALDPESRGLVEERLESLNRDQGATVFLVTHTDYAPACVRARRLWLDGSTIREIAAGRTG